MELSYDHLMHNSLRFVFPLPKTLIIELISFLRHPPQSSSARKPELERFKSQFRIKRLYRFASTRTNPTRETLLFPRDERGNKFLNTENNHDVCKLPEWMVNKKKEKIK
jgi:hypothetical protein